jgi:hypothetical protein
MDMPIADRNMMVFAVEMVLVAHVPVPVRKRWRPVVMVQVVGSAVRKSERLAIRDLGSGSWTNNGTFNPVLVVANVAI